MKNSAFTFLTTTAIVAEVTYLLDFNMNAQSDFLFWISEGEARIVELNNDDLKRRAVLMEKYSDLPIDFAAALTFTELIQKKSLKTSLLKTEILSAIV